MDYPSPRIGPQRKKPMLTIKEQIAHLKLKKYGEEMPTWVDVMLHV